MSKVTGPLMSLDASGTVGKTATFSKWKGRNYVRLRVTPANPKSDSQATTRVALGVVGKMLSFVLYPTKFNEGIFSDWFTKATQVASAGQSWISYCSRQILGTGLSTFAANRTAYAGIDAGAKTEYATGATALGLTSFNLSYGNEDAVTGAEQLYHMAKLAVAQLDFTFEEEGSSVDDPDTADITALVSFIKDDASS